MRAISASASRSSCSLPLICVPPATASCGSLGPRRLGCGPLPMELAQRRLPQSQAAPALLVAFARARLRAVRCRTPRIRHALADDVAEPPVGPDDRGRAAEE